MQTPPEVQVFAKRVIEDGGKIIDLEYCQKYTRLSKQLIIWSNGKFVGDANMGVKKDAANAVSKLYDLSGNNNDATSGVTVNNQPVWTAGVQGGRAGLVFDGNDDNLTGSDANFPLGDTPRHELLVMKLDTVAKTFHEFTSYGEFSNTHGFLFSSDGLGKSDKILIGYYSFNSGNFGTLTTDTQIVEMGQESSAVAIYLYLNGTGASVSLPGTPCDTIAGGAAGFRIGYGWNASYLDGVLFTNTIFNTALTTAQRTATEAFLNAYYSIY